MVEKPAVLLRRSWLPTMGMRLPVLLIHRHVPPRTRSPMQELAPLHHAPLPANYCELCCHNIIQHPRLSVLASGP
jgi:hypothetical protein